MTTKRKSGSAYRCVALYTGTVHYCTRYCTCTVHVLCSFELLDGSDWLNESDFRQSAVGWLPIDIPSQSTTSTRTLNCL
jgi:hypothetical protein